MDIPITGTLAPRFEIAQVGNSSQIVPKGTNKKAKKAASKAKKAAKSKAVSGSGSGAAAKAAPARASEESKEAKVYKKSTMSIDERFEICKSVGEECIKESDLRTLLETKDHPICYDGFEPSGRMHIAQGILKSINVNKLTSAGCVFKFWVADWFALLNNKMGGDLEKIRTVGRYMIEVWKAAGMNMDNVEFLWASDEINAHSDEYWRLVMNIATKNSVTRMQRCCTIMGRKESSDQPAAQIMYPAMQCADVFFLKADICQLGMDQRKVNMLAREYCDVLGRTQKPVILSHHMLMGLKQGQEKMSKSSPDSAIFMEDSAASVKKKIKKAYCPPGEVTGNPVLDWLEHIVFAKDGKFTVNRKPEYGGDVTYTSMDAVRADYVSEALHPGDLKISLANAINVMLEPVRKHFETPENAALLEAVRSFRVTK